jgi:UDP-glucose 4-epimerase
MNTLSIRSLQVQRFLIIQKSNKFQRIQNLTNMEKPVLVFGAAGFIGTYLIDELIKRGYQVVASDINDIGEKYYKKNNVPFIPVDITCKDDFNRLSNESFEAVIHLAALQPANFSSSNYTIEDYIKINVNGTLNILEFCRAHTIPKVIYASSHRNTSGLWAKNTAIKETDGRALQYDGEYSMFSISESSAQDLVEYYNANCGVR